MMQEMFYTSNLKVASALLTLGFEPLKPPITHAVRADQKSTVVFWFHPENHEGVSATSVMHGMTKGADELSEDDPINYMRCVLANRDELVGIVKNAPKHVIITRNGRKCAIRDDTSEEARNKLYTIL